MDINKTASGEPDARKGLSASDVYSLLEVYQKADPARDKRGNILKCYFRHPHAVKTTDDCLLARPANANYGLLAFLVDKQRKVFMDMIRNRLTAFSIQVDDGLEVKGYEGPELERARRMWSNHITHAFERYCIRKWDRYDNMMQVMVLNMLLFSRGHLWWTDAASMECRAVYSGDVLVPPGSGQIPSDWDSCFVIRDMDFHELWKRAEQPNWNKKAIMELLKANSSEDSKRKSVEEFTRALEDGTSTLDQQAKRQTKVAFFYQREEGGQITSYVIPESGFPVMVNAEGVKKDAEFLYKMEGYSDSMDAVIATVIDNPALGSFYKTPSFAESMYVSCNLYDDRMNMAGNAAALNCMLMLQGGDEATFRRQSKLKLRDRMWFPPGMTPAQVRFTLPVQESMEFARSIYQQSVNAAGAAQIGATNDAGAKTPKSATQSWFDGKIQEAMQSADLKAFSVSLNCWGHEAYSRFIKQSPAEGTKLSHGRKLFERYLESKGVPKEAWDSENVEVTSRLSQNSGNSASKLQNAMATLDLLARRPASKGEALAIKEGLIAINGADGVDDFVDDNDYKVVDNEDRLIGHENEQLRDPGAKVENIPVMASDNHVRHLFGKDVDGTVPGHLADAWETVMEVQQMMQVAPDPSDEGMFLDKLANAITELETKLKHSAAHAGMLQSDPTKEMWLRRAAELIHQMEKILGGMAKAFQQLQQKRAQRLMEERQAQAEAQTQQTDGAAKEQQQIIIEKEKANVALGNKLLEGEVKRSEMQKDAEAKRQAMMSEQSLKAGMQAAQKDSKGPREPRTPKAKQS